MRLARFGLGLLLASGATLLAQPPAAAAGFRPPRLIEIPGSDHFAPMAADDFRQAVEFLDGAAQGSGG